MATKSTKSNGTAKSYAAQLVAAKDRAAADKIAAAAVSKAKAVLADDANGAKWVENWLPTLFILYYALKGKAKATGEVSKSGKDIKLYPSLLVRDLAASSFGLTTWTQAGDDADTVRILGQLAGVGVIAEQKTKVGPTVVPAGHVREATTSGMDKLRALLESVK